MQLFSVLVIGINIISFLIILFFVIPLQIKEAQVKNGLAKLRIQLLLYGLAMDIISLLLMYIGYHLFYNIHHLNLVFAILFISVCVFGLAIIGYNIYHQQYTLKNIKLHEKIDR